MYRLILEVIVAILPNNKSEALTVKEIRVILKERGIEVSRSTLSNILRRFVEEGLLKREQILKKGRGIYVYWRVIAPPVPKEIKPETKVRVTETGFDLIFNPPTKEVKPETKVSFPHKCHICGEDFQTPQALGSHQDSKHKGYISNTTVESLIKDLMKENKIWRGNATELSMEFGFTSPRAISTSLSEIEENLKKQGILIKRTQSHGANKISIYNLERITKEELIQSESKMGISLKEQLMQRPTTEIKERLPDNSGKELESLRKEIEGLENRITELDGKIESLKLSQRKRDLERKVIELEETFRKLQNEEWGVREGILK